MRALLRKHWNLEWMFERSGSTGMCILGGGAAIVYGAAELGFSGIIVKDSDTSTGAWAGRCFLAPRVSLQSWARSPSLEVQGDAVRHRLGDGGLQRPVDTRIGMARCEEAWPLGVMPHRCCLSRATDNPAPHLHPACQEPIFKRWNRSKCRTQFRRSWSGRLTCAWIHSLA
jgi:hypothetical protein